MDYFLLVIVETNPKWVEYQKNRKITLDKKKETSQVVMGEVIVEEQAFNDKDHEAEIFRKLSKKNMEPSKCLIKFNPFIDKLAEDFENLGLGTRHKYISQNGRYIYHIAIIDYLQAFNLEKRLENLIKVWLYNREEYKISAVAPEMYCHRFFKFMKDNVIINQLSNKKEGESSFV